MDGYETLLGHIAERVTIGMAYHKIGQPIEDQPPSIYELVLSDHIDYANPRSFGIKSENGINPYDYFVTSGDAVEKAKVLERDLWQYAGELRRRVFEIIAKECDCDISEAQRLYRNGTRPNKPRRLGEYESAVWRSAGQSRKLLNALKKVKGSDCFLETEWEDHHLLCIPKNPRK